MPIYNLTLEKVNEMNEEKISLAEKIKNYKNKTIENIWLEEIEELENKII